MYNPAQNDRSRLEFPMDLALPEIRGTGLNDPLKFFPALTVNDQLLANSIIEREKANHSSEATENNPA